MARLPWLRSAKTGFSKTAAGWTCRKISMLGSLAIEITDLRLRRSYDPTKNEAFHFYRTALLGLIKYMFARARYLFTWLWPPIPHRFASDRAPLWYCKTHTVISEFLGIPSGNFPQAAARNGDGSSRGTKRATKWGEKCGKVCA